MFNDLSNMNAIDKRTKIPLRNFNTINNKEETTQALIHDKTKWKKADLEESKRNLFPTSLISSELTPAI